MYKSIFSLYLIIFGCYILFTRVPDYFDGELYPAIITLVKDTSGIPVPMAKYNYEGKDFTIDARYFPYQYSKGEQVTIILEKEHPQKAAIYRLGGYWLSWGELIGSIVAAIVLLQVAIAITKNPTPEALLEQLSYKEEKKTKYD